MRGACPSWCLPAALALLVCPATAAAQAPTGTTGPPPAAALASLALVTPVAAPGGRVVLRVGAGDGGVRLQLRRGAGRWERVRTLRRRAAPRRVVVRAPLKGSVAAFRLARGAQRGTVRTVRLRPMTLAAVGDVNLGDGAARRDADVVVATFHWGIERATTESPAQRTLARLTRAPPASSASGWPRTACAPWAPPPPASSAVAPSSEARRRPATRGRGADGLACPGPASAAVRHRAAARRARPHRRSSAQRGW